MQTLKRTLGGLRKLAKNRLFFLFLCCNVLMLIASGALLIKLFTSSDGFLRAVVAIPFLLGAILSVLLGFCLFAEGVLRPYLYITGERGQRGRRRDYADELIDLVEKKQGLKEKDSNYQLLQKQAQINALHQQINPHFLYNALDSARGLAYSENAQKTAGMIESLAVFFRYTIGGKDDLVSIFDELHGIENYVAIQRHRFVNQFRFQYQMELTDEQAQRTMLPRLTLQPIVENSFKHGLLYKKEDAEILIKLIATRTRLIICIIDNGCGIPQQKLCEINDQLRSGQQGGGAAQKEHGSGIALQNINARIRIHFGAEYGLHLFSTPGLGTEVQITIPLPEVIQSDE